VALEGDKEAVETLGRMQEHLKMNHIDVPGYRLGRKLAIDAARESFQGDAEADQMLTREYRKGFEVPTTV
jgi:hypothetical protein